MYASMNRKLANVSSCMFEFLLFRYTSVLFTLVLMLSSELAISPLCCRMPGHTISQTRQVSRMWNLIDQTGSHFVYIAGRKTACVQAMSF